MTTILDIGELASSLGAYRERMAQTRHDCNVDFPWYPYDILGNLTHLDLLLHGANRDLAALAGDLAVADIGAADGDLAFTLEQEFGWKIDLIDTAFANMNGLRGARTLRDRLDSDVQIWDIDLDSQFRMPSERYGLVFLLGILYHLQNPLYVLRELSRRSNHLLLSTRVVRSAGQARTPIGDLPVGYLVGPAETNNDPTNYWMLSPAGLNRLVERAGWVVEEQMSFGDLVQSDPSSPDHDERAFMLLRSREHEGFGPAVASSTVEIAASPPGSSKSGSASPAPTRGIAVAHRLRSALAGFTSRPDEAPGPPLTLPPVPQRRDPVLLCWPLDHFYSPVPDSRSLVQEPERSRVWPPEPRPTPGLDWRQDQQIAIFKDELARQDEIKLPSGPTNDKRDYHAANGMFSRLDAWILQGVLRRYRPVRMIEVGCGWSSLLTARINREYLGGSLDFTCIEPYPPEFLLGGVEGIADLISQPVQQVPVETFLKLSDGDVLFIDSSHTVKTGGDVTFLLEEVIPRLAPGVLVHFHDIFLPWDYPEEWIRLGRAWNEQYAVRAFLSFNSAFEILLSSGWLSYYQPDLLAEFLPGYPEQYRDGGGSLWIRRAR